MITFINYKTIMAEAKGKARTKIDGKLQDVETIYDVFKGAGTYFAPEIAVHCSKTATQVAYYIYKKLSQNQTSFRIVTKEVINSGLVNAKTPDRVRDAIKELIKAGVMIAWKDIEGIDEYNFDIDSIIIMDNENPTKAEKEKGLTKIITKYKLMPFEKKTNILVDIGLKEYLNLLKVGC